MESNKHIVEKETDLLVKAVGGEMTRNTAWIFVAADAEFYEQRKDLQREFKDLGTYLAFRRAERAGKVRIHGEQ